GDRSLAGAARPFGGCVAGLPWSACYVGSRVCGLLGSVAGEGRPPDPRSRERREPVDLEANQGSGGEHEYSSGDGDRGDRARAAQLDGELPGLVDQGEVATTGAVREQVAAIAAAEVVGPAVAVGKRHGALPVAEPQVG